MRGWVLLNNPPTSTSTSTHLATLKVVGEMDGRMRRYGQETSPERSKVWTELPPRYRRPSQQGTMKVPVVYYICRNRQLDHPHFIEVSLSSPDGLYLRDVVDRLNLLRGKGMPARYSWSCKRSYENGFVWHDLAEDDLVIPAGDEYVLKGTELLGQSPSDRLHHSTGNLQLQSPEQSKQEPPILSRIQGAHPFPSNPVAVIVKEARTPPLPSQQEGELLQTSCQSISHPSPEMGLSGPGVYLVPKAKYVDASTQTEDRGKSIACGQDTRMKCVSIDYEPIDLEFKASRRNRIPCSNEGADNRMGEISPPPTASIALSPIGRMETLESLIRADVNRMNRLGILEEEALIAPTKAKLKFSNMLTQLVTCGSISVKDHHSFGPLATYKKRLSHMKFPSPMLARSMILGELDFLLENQRVMGLRQEDRRCCSRSMIETKQHKKEGGDRNSESHDSNWNEHKVVHSARLKCLPQTTKITSCKHFWKETMPPISDANTSSRLDSHKFTPLCSSKTGSRRIADDFSIEGSSMSLESFKQENKETQS